MQNANKMHKNKTKAEKNFTHLPHMSYYLHLSRVNAEKEILIQPMKKFN